MNSTTVYTKLTKADDSFEIQSGTQLFKDTTLSEERKIEFLKRDETEYLCSSVVHKARKFEGMTAILLKLFKDNA